MPFCPTHEIECPAFNDQVCFSGEDLLVQGMKRGTCAEDEMWREIRKICKQIDDSKLRVTAGDVRPTDLALVLTGMENIQPEQMQWGFTRKYQDWLLINAKVETILEKPIFRDSVRHCRCVISAAGFYEWNRHKEKVTFTMPESKILYMAGIWQPTENHSQFTILTTAPILC